MSHRAPAQKEFRSGGGVEMRLFNLSTPLKVTKASFKNESGYTKN